jgi:dihydroorotase
LEMLPGTPGIKVFMGSSTGTLLIEDDDTLRRVLESGSRRVAVHSEDEPRLRERKAIVKPENGAADHPVWRDAETARLSTERLFKLSAETKRPVHLLHVSSADELPLIEAAKRDGLGVTAEVTPQHLWFYAPDCYERLGTLAQMNPPIRDSWHQMALRRAVADGLFDMIGSDHAPHTLEEKAQAYPASPSGMPGVQTMLPVMLDMVSTGLISLEQLVVLASEGPARVFGISNKGFVREGFDADLCLVDLKAARIVSREAVESKCGWSPWEGECLTGWPRHVVVGGQVRVLDGKLVGRPNGRALEFDWKGR